MWARVNSHTPVIFTCKKRKKSSFMNTPSTFLIHDQDLSPTGKNFAFSVEKEISFHFHISTPLVYPSDRMRNYNPLWSDFEGKGLGMLPLGKNGRTLSTMKPLEEHLWQ